MKILHLISGGETGGSKNHLLSLLEKMNKEEILLGVFQEGKLSEEARDLGIPLMVFGQSSRYDFSIINKIKRVIKEQGIRIVHTHGPRTNLYTYLIRKMIPFKWITTMHSDPSQDFIKGGVKGKLFTSMNMTVIKKIDHFFAVSERFKDMLVGFGLNRDKITTIYNGINFHVPLTCQLTRQDFNLEEKDFVVIMVARLHPIKGHTVVFDAMKQLTSIDNRVKLLLVGDGPMRQELENEVVQKGLQDQVQFLGFQQDVHSYLCISDIKLLASYSESFPLVILEAARAHIPVISTDVGGVKDLISSPELGWIVPTKDSVSITKALQKAIALKEKEQLQKVGDTLYTKASANYSVEQLMNQTLETYKKLLS